MRLRKLPRNKDTNEDEEPSEDQDNDEDMGMAIDGM